MKIKNYLCVAAAAFLAIGTVACNKGAKAAGETEAQMEDQLETANMLTEAAITEAYANANGVAMLVDDNMFRPDTKVPALVVLDFNAVWCVPCKKLTPAFDQVSKDMEGKAWFFSVDIDNMIATRDAFEIQSVPTVVFLRPNGKVESFVGLGPFLGEGADLDNLSEEQLTELITNNMRKLVEEAI